MNIEDPSEELKPLAIESKLPLKAVGIENLKEANPQHMPPHRYLHPWFARRPTPASRLAILASVLPPSVNSDDLLKLIQIGPKEPIDEDIASYVESKKATESERKGTLGEHYGYPRPFTKSPNKNELDDLHDTLREHWGGDLPTVLDPTAGGGVIPFESLRYNLPTIANELNPVPSLILKVILEFAPHVGSIEQDLIKWGQKINEIAGENTSELFPSESTDQIVSHYACTYTVDCRECGCDIPLVKKWWLRKNSSSSGFAVKPIVSNDGENISYEYVELPKDVEKSQYDPQDGPFSRGGAECLNCGVVTETEAIKQSLYDDDYNIEVFGVKYVNKGSGSGYRAPTSADQEAIEIAKKRIKSEYELSSLLDIDRYIGDIHDRSAIYGVKKWKDGFTPRQIVTHYEYLQAYEQSIPKIKSQYDQAKAEAILTILALVASKSIDRSSRFSPLDTSKGYPGDALGGKNYGLQWAFVENNPYAGNQCYLDILNRVSGSYQEIVNYLQDSSPDRSTVLNGDAADLDIPDDSVQSVVIDPPYYDSIIYSEMSDMPYVWLKEYLGDIYPDVFSRELTDKESEAVANVAEYEGIVGESRSKQEMANRHYESKMASIFNELYRVVEPGGVMTVMFTHKETNAWDTLTMSLIQSGFIITSTHPITSEMPQRTDTRGGGSADSTLLLTGRKPHEDFNSKESVPTLWNDVKSDTRKAAKQAARELIDSGLSLTKTDVIISAFGPTLRVFTNAYPVVDDEDNEVPPRRALEEAREAVTQVLVDEYLEAEGIEDLDDVSEWYILSWLVHESQTFSYDEGHQLGLGIGVDIDNIKSSTKTWRKSRGDISLRGHADRVQNINEKPENRSSRTPVNPDDLSFGLAIDKVHAAMHVYDVQGESACCDWLRERNFDSDSTFKATLKALLQVLPHDHEDWELARDLAAGRTRDVLDLAFSPNVFAEDSEQTQQKGIDDY